MRAKTQVKIPVYAAFMVLVVVFVIACQWWWKKHEPVEIDYEPTCDQAQNHIMEIDCQQFFMIPGDDSVWGTNDDISFVVFCETVQNSGIISLNLRCIMKSKTCSQVERCLANVAD